MENRDADLERPCTAAAGARVCRGGKRLVADLDARYRRGPTSSSISRDLVAAPRDDHFRCGELKSPPGT